MSQKLYELQEQLNQIDNILADNTNPETEEILESAKEQILQAIDGKVENILEFISDCRARAEYLMEEENRLYKKRKSLEKKVEYLKSLVFGVMKQSDLKKATYGTWDVSIAKNPGKLIIDADIDKFPVWLVKTSYSLDKDAVKKNMTGDVAEIYTEDGEKIQLAHMEYSESLRVK